MNIIDVIPYGRMNAITGKELAKLLNSTPRDIRNRISKARRDTMILNLQDGKGYFRPIKGLEDDLIKKFYAQEKRRAKHIFWTLHSCRSYIRGLE